MKKSLKIIILLLIILTLTGCLDILHTVSLHKGKADITVRFTVQKSLLNFASSLSGEEYDDSEIMGMGDDIFSDFNGLPTEVISINTASHVGAELRFSGRVNELLEKLEGADFLPVKNGAGYDISIPGMGDEALNDESSQAFLSGSQYMLLIDLSGDMKNIRKARLKMPGGLKADGDSVFVNIYGSSMVIEISMGVLFNTKDNIIVELLP